MAQPPGWYADVSMPGFERWWDGGSWSHVTRPVPGTAPVAPPAPAAEPSAAVGTPYASADPYASPPVSQPAPPQAPAGTPYATGQYGTPQYGTTPYPGQPYPGAMPYQMPAPGPVTPDGAPLGGRWARLGASILDGLLLGAVITALGIQQLRIVIDAYLSWIDEATKAAEASQVMPQPTFLNDPQVARAITIFSVITILVQILYAAVLVALRGATLGKMALGLKVRRVAAPGPVGWGPAVLRAVAAEAPRMVPFVGSLWSLLDPAWCLWDPQRQCLHDKIARTVVVKAR